MNQPEWWSSPMKLMSDSAPPKPLPESSEPIAQEQEEQNDEEEPDMISMGLNLGSVATKAILGKTSLGGAIGMPLSKDGLKKQLLGNVRPNFR
jgi:hypothetical protein